MGGLPVSDVRTMDEVISRSTSRQRFNMLLMTVFAGAALFLAAIGIYGLMAYSVEPRTQKIGIRLALGAEAGQARRMDEVISRSTSRQRFNMLLATVFAGAALFLAAIGIYGLMAYSVEPRTQKIGSSWPWRRSRRAAHGGAARHGPGADRSGGRTGRVLRPAVALLLGAVSLIAIWLPARRATQVDPVVALRCE